ncbi:MAG: SbcC/MukB-like Walker B domain-containing protein, partial [Eubacteriales bacterium]|nr:SbcC/MukB-like Walker B domain-containing protein [Eubacteriales bacterium]
LEEGIKDLKQRIERYNERTIRFQNMLMEAQANIKASEEVLIQSVKEYEMAGEVLGKKQKLWELRCRQSIFESEEDFVDSFMSAEEKNRQREVVIRFETELETAKEAWKEQEMLLDNQRASDVSAEKQKLQILAEKQKKVAKEWIVKQQFCERMQKDLQNLSKRKAAYEVQKSKTDADLEFVNRLRGRTGISLQRYVLGVMLSSITVEANRLLKHVHGGRYQLYRTDAIAGTGHKGGLELEVLDAQSNERRSVTTLSGGEKFLVALSLAIGLSTVVQAQGNGMRLGAMFIDEGFGSLDQNSIYDALEVLQGIQKANGLVGIISHVELLRDVIPSKIEVHKSKSGSELHI